MNEYVLHEQLLALEGIAGQYADGVRTARRIRQTVERIKSQLYRVAVIGEFKRGKSSLINAIIGAEVLPTDILPMTAAVTRVTYGEKRRILIRFKDGTTQERTVEELIDFATKYDAEKERTAAMIREIEVTYPSVFCRNHIDILDTPGLNDNESMTEVTMSVLGDVDAAIMVISAKAPLSMTEQALILDMIGRPQIRHIIFVVTHIDFVRRASEQDKLIRFIQNRLSSEVLEAAKNTFAGQENVLRKAKEILEKPDIFGVSSVLAMDGFTHDDEELLEESRFPQFKKELLALLTAAQTGDVQAQTMEAAEEVSQRLERWHKASAGALAAAKDIQCKKLDACVEYYDTSADFLDRLLNNMDQQLSEQGICWDDGTLPRMYTELTGPYIRSLSALRSHTNTDSHIRQALAQGRREAEEAACVYAVRLESQIREAMMDVLDAFQEQRAACGFSDEAFARDYARWSETPFPQFPQWADPTPPLPNLVGCNVMPYVHASVGDALNAYAGGISHFVASWRTLLVGQNTRDREDRTPVVRAEEEIARIGIQEDMMNRKYQKNVEKMKQIRETLGLPV